MPLTARRIAPAILLLGLTMLHAQIPGRNVNMVSGTKWPDGDPFLQRQNEPSIAVSSRNPRHLLAGSNDYRTVDLPGLPDDETGDAWLGVFKSFDGGQTWRSTVHPGCAQNVAQCDGAPALKAYQAGADPVVRAGTSGMFYYSGIAFNRGEDAPSAVFVSRFIDLNNDEAGDPVKYLGTTVVARSDGDYFIDKPWMAVDIPRAGAQTCSLSAPGRTASQRVDQKIAAGNIYLAYTTFEDEAAPPSQIRFVRSTDCGQTFSAPLVVADDALHQGVTVAVDPSNGNVYLAWRRFKSEGQTNAILFARSTDGGKTFSEPAVLAEIAPFDQGTTAVSFRSNSYPTMAVDGSGRIYVAWAERGFGLDGDARIVLTTSADGAQWTQRYAIDNPQARGHQLMPAMAFAGGKLTIVYYDLREDATVAVYQPLGGGLFTEKRAPAGDLAATPPRPEKVFTNFVADVAPAGLNLGPLLRRHTIDVRSAQADAGEAPEFNASRLSQYIYGSRKGSTLVEQLQVNPPNLPLFRQGTAPFLGDYIDLAASPSFLPGDQPGTWKFPTEPLGTVLFHATWTDNRDVRPPADGNWANYTPPVSDSVTGVSLFDPSQAQPQCRVGQTGMRDQNIYTAQISQGLIVGAPTNSKALSGDAVRSFVVSVQNSTNLRKNYRLTVTAQPKSGKASFLQFPTPNLPDPLLSVDVQIAPNSSASRTVFVRSAEVLATIPVAVQEIAAPNAAGVVAGGLQGSVLLNPDPLAPANPDIAGGERFNPDIANPDIANPDIANPDIANPDIANPDIANPDIANPDIANPDIANPDIANPDIANPDIANPDIANPDIANPDIANPDIANGSISDATWRVINRGNTTAIYSVKLLVASRLKPGLKWQLIIHRPYANPVAKDCSLVQRPQTVVVANIISPKLQTQDSVVTGASSGAKQPVGAQFSTIERAAEIVDDSLDNATVAVAPGETIYLTLRFYSPDKQPLDFDVAKTVTAVTTSHASNTGSVQPPAAASNLTIITTSLPGAVVGAYYSVALTAAGGTQPYRWSLTGGSLPPGLNFGTDGSITGTVSNGASGPYTFFVSVADATGAKQSLALGLTIQVSQVNLKVSGFTAGVPSGGAAKAGDTITLRLTAVNAGSLASAVGVTISSSATGTPTAACRAASPGPVSIPAGSSQDYTVQCGPAAGNGTLTFSALVSGTDAASATAISVGPVSSNSVTVLSTPPAITATAKTGEFGYLSGTWTNRDVVVTFTCTPATGPVQTKSVTVSNEGAGQSASFDCTDAAGNTASSTFGGINIDRTAPAITGTATTSDGAPYFGAVTSKVVTVQFTCTDNAGGSGIPFQPAPQSVTADGLGQSVTGSCVDRAGNTANLNFGNINVVRTPPTITATAYGLGGAYAFGTWTNQDVIVTPQCQTAGGVAINFQTPPTTFSREGGSQFLRMVCTDAAGNTASVNTGTINIDKTAPVLTLQNRSAESGVWSKTAVTLTWSCVDTLSGVAGSSTVTRSVASEGAGQSVQAGCSDLAGNSVTATATGINVDLTPPVLTPQVSPAAGASGWNTSATTVSFNCTDGLSGVAPGSVTAASVISTDTNSATVPGQCRDVAGNQANTSVVVKVDTTAPGIALVSRTPANAAGWNNTAVTVTWSCTDAGSGPQAPIITQVLSSDGQGQSASATCRDIAGNSNTANTVSGIKIDTVAPTPTILSPLNGAVLNVGARVVANYRCSDATSGIASCTGSQALGTLIPTATPGTYSFSVTAVDNAGNQTSVTSTYRVQQLQ